MYWEADRVYRQIHPEKAAFFEQLVERPVFTRLIDEGRLVGTTVVPGPEPGLRLAHETIWPLSYPHEWCWPMLRDAALLTLDVAAALADDGLMLADGHPWNVLFTGTRPVFIDVGSIDLPHPTLPWPAMAQFNRFARYPLHVAAAGLPELARARLQDLALGVSADLATRALPVGYRLGHPLFAAKLAMNRAAETLADRAPAGARPGVEARPVAADTLAQARRMYFAGLRREIAAIAPGARGAWVSYYAACPSMADAEAAAKQAHMAALFARLAPSTVIDLGANTGQYALEAARGGARVIALDQDESSVAALYAQARAERLDVLPLVMDLGNPSPANGWCAEQRPDALSRFRSELALMLALIHHLVFTGNASLQQVARLARRATRRHAIVEWVAPEDPMAVHLRRTATKDFGFYTEQALVAALAAEGFTVTALEPHAPTRRLLLATLEDSA